LNGSTWRIIRVLTCLVLYILFPKLLPAQQIVADINPEIALSYTIAPVGITVNSSVRAYLVNFALSRGYPFQKCQAPRSYTERSTLPSPS
jgi:hypothetical protein